MAAKGKKSTQRKLTAILCADVVGYSRLMGDDEEATIETLTAYRKVFVSEIKKHRGRVVDAKGDAILAEFASVVDAVSGAVEIQRGLAEKNTELPDDRRMDFRIGINLGDVVVQDDVIYGDGVNVAARLESLAEPGGICISRPVFDQVKSKLKLEYEYMGEQRVKNIAEPLRAYSVRLTPSDNETNEAQPEPVSAALSLPDGVSLELPDRPSIAVLPFTNMSGDPEQDYFSDGLTEDIITDLSKLSGLFIIARNSTFVYKGRSVNAGQVGKELGVAHVLEGSVRRAGNRVRITAQLIAAETGLHVWAERYDRSLEDVFIVQDDITNEIVTALDVKLLSGEHARIWRKSLRNPQARDAYYRATEAIKRVTPETSALNQELFEQVISLEPDSPHGNTGLAWIAWQNAFHGWKPGLMEWATKSRDLAAQALTSDDTHAEAWMVSALANLILRNFDEAETQGQRGLELAPHSAQVTAWYAVLVSHLGRTQEAITLIERSKRLSPVWPIWYDAVGGLARNNLGQYEEAIPLFRLVVEENPGFIKASCGLAVAYAESGRNEEASQQVRQILSHDPNFSIAALVARLPHKDSLVPARFAKSLRKAGLPE